MDKDKIEFPGADFEIDDNENLMISDSVSWLRKDEALRLAQWIIVRYALHEEKELGRD